MRQLVESIQRKGKYKYYQGLINLYILLVGLCVFDGLMSRLFYIAGVIYEANPLMDLVIGEAYLFWALKMTLTASFGLVLLAHERITALKVLIALYGLIFLYHWYILWEVTLK